VFGGHVEPGETLDRALARELREELGITPIRSLALGSALEPNLDVNGAARYHLYRIHAWTGEPSNLGDEHDEIGWFTPDDAVAKQPIVPGVRDLIAAQLLIRQAAAPSP
jgi:8-oxo-dGTP diphosphatase